jgi:hypothetical protein
MRLPQSIEGWTQTEEELRRPHSQLRLQPVMLGPPPELDEAALATAEDDLDPGEMREKRRLLPILIAVGLVVGLGAAGFLAFNHFSGAPVAANLPEIKADTAALTKRLPPAETPVEASTNPAMGGISTDLVPPSTDGLVPARRVNAVRIIVENDREVVQPR